MCCGLPCGDWYACAHLVALGCAQLGLLFEAPASFWRPSWGSCLDHLVFALGNAMFASAWSRWVALACERLWVVGRGCAWLSFALLNCLWWSLFAPGAPGCARLRLAVVGCPCLRLAAPVHARMSFGRAWLRLVARRGAVVGLCLITLGLVWRRRCAWWRLFVGKCA